MTSPGLQMRMAFHEEQANRLLNTNPLIAEFYFHLTQVEHLKKQLLSETSSQPAELSPPGQQEVSLEAMNGTH